MIGAGSAGLSLAAGAVQMGASVILIEQSRMGGECLNTGCVPSKALLAAAARGEGFAAAYEHMRGAIATPSSRTIPPSASAASAPTWCSARPASSRRASSRWAIPA